MFFGKKEVPEPQKPPIRVTIITDEYIIDAMDDPELSILQAAYDSEIQEPTGGVIVLKDAHVQALGQVNTPARTFAEWRMPSFVKVIAIVSDDPAAEDFMVDGWTDYEYPFKAIIYAGAFTIEGKILSEDEAPPTFEIRTFVPLEESTITYQLDKKEKVIRGRWGVVNSVLMHGFSIEK
jgi:hypothetical protein